MSKNLTRKGLALSATLALGSTLFAGAPAFAAVGIDLDSNGTSGVFGQVEATSFVFTANGNSEFPVGNATQLRVHVKNLNGGTASAFKINGTTLDADNTADAGSTNTANAIATASGGLTAASLGTTIGDTAVFGLGETTGEQAGATSLGGASAMTSPFTFAFTSNAADDAAKAYEVTVFADTNNNGTKDVNETASSTKTVTFYDMVDLTATVSFDALTEGNTNVTGSAVIANVDMKQISVLDTGIWLSSGTDTNLGGHASAAVRLVLPGAASGSAGVIVYDSTDKRFEFATDGVGTTAVKLFAALVKDTAVKGKFLLDTPAGGSAAYTDAITTTGSATVAARTTGSIVVDTVDSATTSRAAADTTVTADVALNSAYAVKAIVKDASTPAKVLSGKAVTAVVTVPTGTLSSSVTATINGTTYTDETKLPGATGIAKLALTTDANGEVVVNITTAGLSDGDDVTVAFTVENRTATITSNNATIAYTGYIDNAIDGVATTDGVAAKVNVIVRDQFGGKPANGKFSVSSDWVSSGQTTAATASSESFVAVVDGAASLSILDNGTGAGENVYDIELNTLGANGGVASTADIKANFSVAIKAAADLVAGSVSVEDSAASVITQNSTTKVYTDALVTGNGNSAELLLGDMFANDSRSATVSAPDVSGADGADITGYVKTAASATAAAVGIAGVPVTISAAGLLFSTGVQNSGTVYAVGSITVVTDKNGFYDVQAWSNKAGEQTVKITAGGQSATLVLDEFDAAGTDTGTAITLAANQVVKAGRTLVITGSLADKYGNPVQASANDFSAVYTGPGYEFTSAVTATTAAGTFTIRVLLGTGEVGVATVAVAYDPDGSLTSADSDADRVSASQTILIGISATVSAAKKAATTVVKNAAGATVTVVSGTKSVTKVATSDTFKLSLTKLTKGKKTVKVYVNDILVSSKSVTVKK
jgi:hypothetical protein